MCITLIRDVQRLLQDSSFLFSQISYMKVYMTDRNEFLFSPCELYDTNILQVIGAHCRHTHLPGCYRHAAKGSDSKSLDLCRFDLLQTPDLVENPKHIFPNEKKCQISKKNTTLFHMKPCSKSNKDSGVQQLNHDYGRIRVPICFRWVETLTLASLITIFHLKNPFIHERGGGFKYLCFYFHPESWGKIPNLTSIFFRYWVG